MAGDQTRGFDVLVEMGSDVLKDAPLMTTGGMAQGFDSVVQRLVGGMVLTSLNNAAQPSPVSGVSWAVLINPFDERPLARWPSVSLDWTVQVPPDGRSIVLLATWPLRLRAAAADGTTTSFGRVGQVEFTLSLSVTGSSSTRFSLQLRIDGVSVRADATDAARAFARAIGVVPDGVREFLNSALATALQGPIAGANRIAPPITIGNDFAGIPFSDVQIRKLSENGISSLLLGFVCALGDGETVRTVRGPQLRTFPAAPFSVPPRARPRALSPSLAMAVSVRSGFLLELVRRQASRFHQDLVPGRDIVPPCRILEPINGLSMPGFPRPFCPDPDIPCRVTSGPRMNLRAFSVDVLSLSQLAHGDLNTRLDIDRSRVVDSDHLIRVLFSASVVDVVHPPVEVTAVLALDLQLSAPPGTPLARAVQPTLIAQKITTRWLDVGTIVFLLVVAVFFLALTGGASSFVTAGTVVGLAVGVGVVVGAIVGGIMGGILGAVQSILGAN